MSRRGPAQRYVRRGSEMVVPPPEYPNRIIVTIHVWGSPLSPMLAVLYSGGWQLHYRPLVSLDSVMHASRSSQYGIFL